MTDSKRWDELHAGLNEDGTVEKCVVETFVGFPYALQAPEQYVYELNVENKFIAFTMDNGETDIEVRLPYETIDVFTQMVADGRKAAERMPALNRKRR